MVVYFKGGLGNQLFQYALYESLKAKFPDRNIICDLSYYDAVKVHYGYELDKIFGLELNLASDIEKDYVKNTLYADSVLSGYFRYVLYYILLKRVIVDKENGYAERIFKNPSEKAIYTGFWQDEKYFLNVKDTVRANLQFSEPKDIQNKKTIEEIKNTNSVSVHIRRGDYLNYTETYAPLCDTNYYQDAVKYIKERINNPVFYVFSDDIEWVKQNLELSSDSVFVDWNKGEQSFRDMQLMSCCKHNIIANSTFSWWGAWLNNNPNKIVLCPNKFHRKDDKYNKGIVCNDWITIPI